MTNAARIKILIVSIVAMLATTAACSLVGYASARAAPPSADVPLRSSADLPAAPQLKAAPPITPESPPDVSLIEQLYRDGALVAAAGLAVYMLLALALRVDRRRAFYYSAGLTALGMIVDSFAAGRTPTSGMLITAAVTLVSILVRGPDPQPKAST